MFEKALLDRAQRRSGWSWMGLVVQAGLVGAAVAVPMIHPEVIAVVLPKVTLHVPLTPAPPVEVEVQQPTSAAPAGSVQNAVRRVTRIFTAPARYDNPVATIVDGPDVSFVPFDVGGGRVIATGPSQTIAGASFPTAAPPKPPETRKPETPSRPVRVGGIVRPPQVLSRVNPVYPPLAKQSRVSGVVKLEGIIAKDGTIQQLKVLSGHPLLVKAALEAVTSWRYTPTLLNGEPVEVIAPIDVNFVLSQ